jgi:hypothetical protein
MENIIHDLLASLFWSVAAHEVRNTYQRKPFTSRSYARERGRGWVSTILFKVILPIMGKTTIWPHLLKILPPPNSAKLVTEPLIHGPLKDI